LDMSKASYLCGPIVDEHQNNMLLGELSSHQ
jgi:hypothetical protein